MRRYSLFSVALLMTVLFSLSAYADHAKKYGHQWWEKDKYQELNLNQAQINQLVQIHEVHTANMKSMHEGVIKTYQQLKSIMYDPEILDEQVATKFNELLIKRNNLQREKFDMKLAYRSVLNEDQLVMLGEIKKECPKKRSDRSSKKCPGMDKSD